MSDTEQHGDEGDAADEPNAENVPQAVTSPYKVLGQLTEANGVGVLGQNDAGSGTPIGVEGAIPNSTGGYGLYTPDDARIDRNLEVGGSLLGSDIVDSSNLAQGAVTSTEIGDGSIDTLDIGRNGASDGHVLRWSGAEWTTGFPGTTGAATTFSLLAGGEPALRLEPEATPNLVAGEPGNEVRDGAWGATVLGGSNQNPNVVTDAYGTVAGGRGNLVGDDDGSPNSVTDATVGGGRNNEASANGATVPGGIDNVAAADRAFAAGWNAVAEDPYAFVWNDGSGYHDLDGDGTDDALSSSQDVNGSGVTGVGSFHISATGGIRCLTGGSATTYIAPGGSGWSITSSRSAKTNVDPVDPAAVLEGVDDMDIATWEYEDGDGAGTGLRYVGPMAEEFHDILEVGGSDDHINGVNADGVALAAIQGLSSRTEEAAERIEALEGVNDRLRADLDERERQIEELAAENEALRERVQAIEERLDGLAAG